MTANVSFRSDSTAIVGVVLATARAYLQRMSSYLIQFIRWPLGPVFAFATWRITYGASGRAHVDGATLSGFLLVGVFGMITWTSSIWASGYALEWERGEGTSASLFLTPASRAAVVAGYGLGSFVWFLPSFGVLILLGHLTGAHLRVADPAAAAMSAALLILASFAAGFFFSGLFILSRRGNLIANFLQTPVYLLTGMLIPLTLLPGWARPWAEIVPATYAVAALRASTLDGATIQSVSGELVWGLVVSCLWIVIGVIGLRQVEDVAKRTGQLELH